MLLMGVENLANDLAVMYQCVHIDLLAKMFFPVTDVHSKWKSKRCLAFDSPKLCHTLAIVEPPNSGLVLCPLFGGGPLFMLSIGALSHIHYNYNGGCPLIGSINELYFEYSQVRTWVSSYLFIQCHQHSLMPHLFVNLHGITPVHSPPHISLSSPPTSLPHLRVGLG